MSCRKTPSGGRPCGTGRSSAGTADPSRRSPGGRSRARQGVADAGERRVAPPGRGRPSPRGSRGPGRAARAAPASAAAPASPPSRRAGRRVAADLDGRRRRASAGSGSGRRVEQRRARRSWPLDVRLVERVDAEQPPGDRRRVLPQQELRTERAGDGDAVAGVAVGSAVPRRRALAARSSASRAGRPARRPRPRSARGRRGVLDDDRQQAGAVLAGRLGDELLGPVAEADERRSPRRRGPPCRAAGPCRRARRRAPGPGCSGVVRASRSATAAASSSSAPTSTPASPDGTSPNAVSARVAAADARVGQEHRAVAGLAATAAPAASRGR